MLWLINITLILYISGGTYSLTTANDRFLEILFHGRFIYCQSFCQKSVERKSSKKYYFFIFRFDFWPGIRTRASDKPTHYLLGYGDCFRLLQHENDFLMTVHAIQPPQKIIFAEYVKNPGFRNISGPRIQQFSYNW